MFVRSSTVGRDQLVARQFIQVVEHCAASPSGAQETVTVAVTWMAAGWLASITRNGWKWLPAKPLFQSMFSAPVHS
jgi:hypothetical protein